MERPAPALTADAPNAAVAQDGAADPAVTLFICQTCRRPGTPPEDAPEGTRLAAEAMAAACPPGIEVKPVRCLSNCKRGLSAAMVHSGGWSYVFGDLAPASAADLLAGAALFAASTDGLMPWRGRPDALKRGMIARVPPLTFTEETR